MDKLLRDKKAIIVFLLPASILFLVCIIVPIIISGGISLTDWNGMSSPKFVGLKNFERLMSPSEGFTKAAINSFKYAFCSTFIQVPFALLLALILASKVVGERYYLTVFFIPVLISSVVTGQLWMRVFDSQYGILNNFLNAVGLESLTRNWLADTKTALGCVFVALIWQNIGYHMLLLYGAIKTIPTEIYEASKIDGANFFQTSWKITIPLCKPMLRVCLIFAVVGALKMFDIIYVMTNGGPARATEVPSTLMVTTIFGRNMYGFGSSMAVFIIFECFLFAYLIRKLVKVDE